MVFSNWQKRFRIWSSAINICNSLSTNDQEYMVLSDVDLFPHVNELLLVRPSLLLQRCSTNILQISACHALTKFCGTTYSNDQFELFMLFCQLGQDLLHTSIEIQPTFEFSDNCLSFQRLHCTYKTHTNPQSNVATHVGTHPCLLDFLMQFCQCTAL